MKYKIIVPDNIQTIDELKYAIDNGCKFITFQYCITIFIAVTLTRFSPAILIQNTEELNYFKTKYNRLTKIFGWWGLPWGPIRSINALNNNKAGGIDMTDDIMLNIDTESLITKEVDLKLSNQFFLKPNGIDVKAFNKALVKYATDNNKIRKVIVGVFIKTPSRQYLKYTVGIKINADFNENVEIFKKLLYKQFRKDVTFEFIDLSKENEINHFFEKQGKIIVSK